MEHLASAKSKNMSGAIDAFFNGVTLKSVGLNILMGAAVGASVFLCMSAATAMFPAIGFHMSLPFAMTFFASIQTSISTVAMGIKKVHEYYSNDSEKNTETHEAPNCKQKNDVLGLSEKQQENNIPQPDIAVSSLNNQPSNNIATKDINLQQKTNEENLQKIAL